ncbi:PatA/PatG family cyanobactin maturation protease [Aphanizomenon sp. CS-733/32]|uniref:S8 family peptidase n=1 Tax=Aphanizomenon sp. CS-733/32 TaxID=3021715 RepID=UPI00232EA555|nr:PatA/PatG family cyanobactin maturation protease [Aphanizomenon sp. CS-733/32]MDB9307115.1 PatA/PatG family cyanobactin maturation protease [Aphanizomenon sp. CS-733/32]
MLKPSIKSEIHKLWKLTQGDSQICVAVLDGLVDQSHSCLNTANLTRLPTLIHGEATDGSMSGHGTHVASIIFGQPESPVEGIAPQCRGLIVPVFGDNNRKISQLDLSRAIEQAVNAGAHIINISAGQLTDNGEAEGWLDRAVQLCKDHNVLIVAAAGNDGCECLHVPASLPTVLAVGAMNDQGKPIDFSNWGESYQNQGILAPGENILGAKPGGGTQKLSGTSFATPIVSGVAALLLSLQVQRGETPDPGKVRAVLLETAIPCTTKDTDDISRCLLGKLNISGALQYFTGGTMSEELDTVETVDSVEAAGCGCGSADITKNTTNISAAEANLEELVTDELPEIVPASSVTTSTPFTTANISNSRPTTMSNRTSNYITASQAPSDLYAILQQLLSGQIQAEDSENYVERVSIPGILSGRSVKLFSGQVVPVIEVPNTRGLYGWKVNTLVQAAIQTVQAQASEAQEESIRRTLGSFLSRIYYDLRNLGTTSQDRALNFASTNAFQAASTFAEAVATGMELDSITVEKSPFCRLDSDCWDVKLKFFDPENSRRAKKLFRFTIDVSDIIPVTLGEVRSWSTPY